MIQKLLLATTCVALFSCPSFADVIAWEPFNYTPAGDLAGNGAGSFGFSDFWNGHSTFDVQAGNLKSPVSFPESQGNRVTADAFGGNRNVIRTLSQPIGSDNSTVYMSFLMQAEDVVGAGSDAGWFSFTLRSNTGNITIGKDSFASKYKIEDSVGHIARSTINVVANETHLFVLRAKFLPAADEFRLFIDPPTGQLEPTSANVVLNSFDLGMVSNVGLDGPGAFGFDELRIGTTWLDVAPKLPGDYNINGVIDAADYTVWRNTVGSTTDVRADGTGPAGIPDQVIDQFDYDYWKQRYIETNSNNASGTATVPEPSLALMCFAIAAAFVLTNRRQPQRSAGCQA